MSYEVFIRHFVVWKDSKQWKQLTQFSNTKYSQTGSCFSSNCLPTIGWLWGEKSIECKTSSIYKMLGLHILLAADLAFYIQCRLTLPAILIINVCWLITKEEVENAAEHHVSERSGFPLVWLDENITCPSYSTLIASAFSKHNMLGMSEDHFIIV